MRNPPVNWSEGMFLLPHHFQAAEKHYNELLQTSEKWDHAYNYGLQSVDISRDAIGNFQFQLNSCQARMKDGTLVVVGPEQDVDRAELRPGVAGLEEALKGLGTDLKQSLDVQPAVRVYLAVPKIKMGSANVAREGEHGRQRFSELKRSYLEETRGGNEQEVGLKTLNVRLLLSTQDLSGYETLPIAHVQRSSEQSVTPQLDLDYIPPLVSIDAWPPLSRDIVRAIFDIIGKKIEVLTQQIQSRGVSLASREPGDVDRILMLSQLNEAYAILTMWSFAQGIHPLTAYAELCRIVGKLSIFGKERRVPEIPRYDHDDLGRIFRWVRDRILALLDTIQEYQYEQRRFVGAGLGMQVAIDPKWLQSDWKWYVGVLHEEISDSECREIMRAKGQLDWKLGSARQVEQIFTTGQDGVTLEPLARAPNALPPDANLNYYEVSRTNQYWKDVQLAQTLAMRFKLETIVNKDRLQGSHKIIVRYKGRQIPLEFSLFAVQIKE